MSINHMTRSKFRKKSSPGSGTTTPSPTINTHYHRTAQARSQPTDFNAPHRTSPYHYEILESDAAGESGAALRG